MRPHHALMLGSGTVLSLIGFPIGPAGLVLLIAGNVLIPAGMWPRRRASVLGRWAVGIALLLLLSQLLALMLPSLSTFAHTAWDSIALAIFTVMWIAIGLDLAMVAHSRSGKKTASWLAWCGFLIPLGPLYLHVGILFIDPQVTSIARSGLISVIFYGPHVIGLIAFLFCMVNMTDLLEESPES